MANTYTLISSNTLGSNTASVTFSSIPNTYTDLVLKCSSRNSVGNSEIRITLNNSTASNYSYTYLLGYGTGVDSARAGSASYIYSIGATSSQTSSTFSNTEIYIPSYTASQNKIVSSFGTNEDNSSSGSDLGAVSGLWRVTDAISTITLTPGASGNFVTNSSFFLYGIKNS